MVRRRETQQAASVRRYARRQEAVRDDADVRLRVDVAHTEARGRRVADIAKDIGRDAQAGEEGGYEYSFHRVSQILFAVRRRAVPFVITATTWT